MSAAVVARLWRYPVKSMLGERCEALAFDERGAIGDRLFAVRLGDGGFGSGKTTRRFRKLGGLFEFESWFDGDVPLMRGPDGRLLRGDDADLDAQLSTAFGQPVSLVREAEVSHFDAEAVHIVTTGGLAALGEDLGGGPVDARRFRPNLVFEMGADGDLVGRRLAIGEQLVLEIVGATERCVMTALAQAELPLDRRLHRHLVRRAGNQFGHYARVLHPGTAASGDPVTFR